MTDSRYRDPAERGLRFFYRDWRPTRLGLWTNRFMGWWSGVGMPPKFQAVLEIAGRKSGRRRSNPVVIPTVDGKRYLVSRLGPESDWVKNVEAARGEAVIRQGRRRRVHLVAVPLDQTAPILQEYVRLAISGRKHFPLPVDAPLVDFEAHRQFLPCLQNRPVMKGLTRVATSEFPHDKSSAFWRFRWMTRAYISCSQSDAEFGSTRTPRNPVEVEGTCSRPLTKT